MVMFSTAAPAVATVDPEGRTRSLYIYVCSSSTVKEFQLRINDLVPIELHSYNTYPKQSILEPEKVKTRCRQEISCGHCAIPSFAIIQVSV